MSKQYRPLTNSEIEHLVRAGCSCADWSEIEVAENFKPENVRSVQFGGKVRLGIFEKPISFIAGIEGTSGVFNSTIYNCTIGDNTYINNVHTLANYVIEDECIIANITYLAVQGKSSFGNGAEVSVINEAGGREVKIYDSISSQIAYIMAVYRHRTTLIEKLSQMIDNYADKASSSMGRIGYGTKIMNCGTLKNVKIGCKAILEGVNRLENGSINSCEKAFVRIGANVIAKDFIISSGTKILDNVILNEVFVGQGTELGKGYSAEHSVFFANCGGFHGEACSVFAGPFTVTHHKATLLIAGMFSFFNAGSASNQSNHMYKLGSVHQAIFERGCKMGSGSYMLYPARLGPFNVVLGKHAAHPNTKDLPFSYILQSGKQTLIIPGFNLRSAGTLRDISKWPLRDNRTDSVKLDKIIFQAFSPFTIQRMINGIELLQGLLDKSDKDTEYVDYGQCQIKRTWLGNGIELYQLAIDEYLGGVLAERKSKGMSLEKLGDVGTGQWVDMAGLLAPKSEVEKLCDDVEAGTISDTEQLTLRIDEIYNNFENYQWNWVAEQIKGKDHGQVIASWKLAFEKMAQLIAEDAEKEFSETAKIPYGIDGDDDIVNEDFEAVRGTFQTNTFVKKLQAQLEEKRKL